jgi:hypothetical protein
VATSIRLSTAQWLGLPVMGVLPILALLGTFGPRSEPSVAKTGALRISGSLPTRVHFRQRATIVVSLRNLDTNAVSDVRLHLDTAYLGALSNVVVTPALSADGAVHLGTLGPGASASVAIDAEGDRVGTHRGVLIATDAVGDSARLALTTTTFP